MKENYCSTCGKTFNKGELSVRCRLCMHNYHASCWEKTGGCTTWGCAGKPDNKDIDLPIKYQKCPQCGEKVVDFAEQCRYCRSPMKGSVQAENEEVKRIDRASIKVFRKDPILTGLLNLIFPGAGYMYLGQFSKGMFWFLIAVAAWYFTRGIGLIAVYLWVIYDSSRQAVTMNRSVGQEKKKFEKPRLK